MMKNAWPVKAQALGGRHYRQSKEWAVWVDQNFDSYAVEYTYADGTKMYMDGRCMMGAADMYYSHAHGSKGMAVVSSGGDCGTPSSTHRGQNPERGNMIWTSKVNEDEQNPYQNEWNDLVDAIRDDKPYNEVTRGVQASVVTSMGRMAAHTAQEITYEDMLNHTDVYAPGVENFTMDSPPPVRSGPDGKYPVPMPGILAHHEYKMGKMS
jgi:predicted dehydrogenase